MTDVLAPPDVADSYKRPESVLVVVYTKTGKVLLLKRRDHPDFWQSVTGSLHWSEHDRRAAAARELKEETGIDAETALRDLALEFRYEIFPEWRFRYRPGTTHNVEHAYAVELPAPCAVTLSDEHSEYGWFDLSEAATRVPSSSNRETIRQIAERHLPTSREAVVLVHGLWLSGWAMALLARRLRAEGFATYVFSYPSVRRSRRQNADALRAFVEERRADVVHFVGHSLGGVIIQALLADYPKPGRVVTLGSPHRGSAVAVRLSRYYWGRRILGQSIGELLQRPVPPYDLCGREVGLIKGTTPIGLGRVLVRMKQPNDGVVAINEVDWPGAADELALPVSHTAMLWSRQVADRVLAFLRYGRFAP
jgi:8-oxo-dGTP pyrophosphatase MutT (NUDIX family)